MGEDANKTVTGAAPRALACLRNWSIAMVERYQRNKALKRIAKAWQYLRYNTNEGVLLMS